MNPTDLYKIAGMKNQFDRNHPGVARFLQAITRRQLTEGTVIEVSVTYPGEQPMVTNMKVGAQDLEMIRQLREMNPNG